MLQHASEDGKQTLSSNRASRKKEIDIKPTSKARSKDDAYVHVEGKGKS